MREYKLFDAPDVKMLDDESGIITGYASTFANFDDTNERVIAGAFKKHLPDFLKDGFIAIGHNWSTLPIATPMDATEDEHGLFVRAAFHSTASAQDARTVMRERMERGKSVKLSIGYDVLDDEYIEQGRLLKEIKLFEWSYVTVPANQMATVTGVKGLNWKERPVIDHIEAVEASFDDLIERLAELKDRRAKEGRVLAERIRSRLSAHPDRLHEIAGDIETLLKETQPEPKQQTGNHAEDRALRLEWQLRRQRIAMLGVPLL